MSYAELSALHSEYPDDVITIPNSGSQSHGPHQESASSVSRSIPKGIPKGDLEDMSTGKDHSVAGNAGLAQELVGTSTEGLLNLVSEDEDTLALQKQREEEEQKAEEEVQGRFQGDLFLCFTSVSSVTFCCLVLLHNCISRQQHDISSWVCINHTSDLPIVLRMSAMTCTSATMLK